MTVLQEMIKESKRREEMKHKTAQLMIRLYREQQRTANIRVMRKLQRPAAAQIASTIAHHASMGKEILISTPRRIHVRLYPENIADLQIRSWPVPGTLNGMLLGPVTP